MPQKKQKSYKQFIKEIKKISLDIKRKNNSPKKVISANYIHQASNDNNGLSGKYYLEH